MNNKWEHSIERILNNSTKDRGEPSVPGGGGFEFEPPLSDVPLDKRLLAKNECCLPLAFGQSMLCLRGDDLHDDVVENFLPDRENSNSFWSDYVHAQQDKLGEKCKVTFDYTEPGILCVWQHFLHSEEAKPALYDHHAGDGKRQINCIMLVKKGLTQNRDRKQLCDYMIEQRGVYLFEVKPGHMVCIDARCKLIYETDSDFTHAIPLSDHNLDQLGCPETNAQKLQVREVRLDLSVPRTDKMDLVDNDDGAQQAAKKARKGA